MKGVSRGKERERERTASKERQNHRKADRMKQTDRKGESQADLYTDRHGQGSYQQSPKSCWSTSNLTPDPAMNLGFWVIS